jgi:hypothetical protein
VVVNLVIAVCASFVAVSEGKCSRDNAMHVSQTTLEAADLAVAKNMCLHEAYQLLRTFRSPDGEAISVSWSCAPSDGHEGLKPTVHD